MAMPVIISETVNRMFPAFSREYNKNWHNPANTFSDPKNRALVCSTIINHLALENIEEATSLFHIFEQAGAFDARIGVTDSPRKAQRICAARLKEAKDAVFPLSGLAPGAPPQHNLAMGQGIARKLFN